MKFKNLIYTLLAACTMVLAACSPDDYSLGDKTYSSDQLTIDKAFTVTVKGNIVTLTSLVKDCTPLWITPSGRSQEQTLDLKLPFAGSYEVTFGVETPGGYVYGQPYTFTLDQNDFSLLSDSKWFYLADETFREGSAIPNAETLTQGVKKRWYPCDGDYKIGRCTGPVMYITPYDPDGDGQYDAADEENLVYKDIVFGSDNWKPNWDPGFQSWLIPEDDAYMGSYMEFSMDAKNGCVATMFRGESGSKASPTGTNMVGKFNMNLDDAKKPLISFSDCYAMHNTGFDAVCANYTTDIQIVELTPYLLQLVTKRTNSEGNWYICWNFVSEEVIKTGGACIPLDEQELTASTPATPDYDNINTDLFLMEHDGVTYAGSTADLVLDTETPYDWLWWDSSSDPVSGSYSSDADLAAAISANWKSVTGGTYNDTWKPAPTEEEIENFNLVISKTSKTTKDNEYAFTCGDVTGKVTVTESKMTFSRDITIITAGDDTKRKVALTGREFYILADNGVDGLTIGVPETTDANGYVNSYLVANLTHKTISSGPTGPTVVPLESDVTEHMWVENNCIRLAFWSYGSSGEGIFSDVTSVKLKKNQTISVTFKISGVNWTETPKCALIDNNIKTTWEPGCYDLSDAVTVNTNGETTVSLTNTSGSTQTFTNTCLDLSIQGCGTLEDGTAIANGVTLTGVNIEVVSCTIQ